MVSLKPVPGLSRISASCKTQAEVWCLKLASLQHLISHSGVAEDSSLV
jgi:hypothetical protein